MSTFKKTVTIEGSVVYQKDAPFARVSQETLDVSEDTLFILRQFCKEPMEIERLLDEISVCTMVSIGLYDYNVATELEDFMDLFPVAPWGTLVGPFKITINENLLEN